MKFKSIIAQVSALAGSYRILYTPRATWKSPYLFLGLNPAGTDADAADAFVEAGNAYLTERWGTGGTYNPLQKQVKAFFDGLTARGSTADWCVSNLVFYRSPSWDVMAGKKDHIALCHNVWRKRFTKATPRVIVTNGISVYTEVKKLLASIGFTTTEECLMPRAWDGPHTCKMTNGTDIVTLVGFPHLSRYGVITRKKNAATIAAVLDSIAAL